MEKDVTGVEQKLGVNTVITGTPTSDEDHVVISRKTWTESTEKFQTLASNVKQVMGAQITEEQVHQLMLAMEHTIYAHREVATDEDRKVRDKSGKGREVGKESGKGVGKKGSGETPARASDVEMKEGEERGAKTEPGSQEDTNAMATKERKKDTEKAKE